MKKPTKDTNKDAIIDQMFKEVEDAVDYFKNKIEKHELQAFLDEDNNILGKKVDEDELISPESVACLGSYTSLLSLLNEMKSIRDGKPSEYKPIILAHDPKTGKETRITADQLPEEVKDALRKVLEGDK